jgi:hypothetical protein
MARGIISTILGGVAGGFEGLAADQKRMRERADREREREDRLERERAEAAQREFMNALTIRQMGGRAGSVLRRDEAAAAGQRLRDTEVSRALDQAPLFEQPEEAPVGRSALESALQARVPAPDFSAERRGIPQFTPMTEDEDYEQIAGPQGQVFSFVTPEAAERRRRQEAAEAAESSATAAEEAERARFQQLIDMGATRAQAMEAVYGVRQDRPESGQSRPALVETIEYLQGIPELSGTPIQDLVKLARGGSVGGASGEDALRDHMLNFMSDRPSTRYGERGRAPSDAEMRREALSVAPLLGVSRDVVDRLFPASTGPMSRPFGEQFLRSPAQAPATSRNERQPVRVEDLSDEELERIARGGR